jgi:trimeric autotransporter adhesin
MFDRRLRFAALCTGLIVLWAFSVSAAAMPRGPFARPMPARPAPGDPPGVHTRTRSYAMYCTTNGSGGVTSGGASNVAGGANSGVLSGQQNQTCNQLSVIVGGDTNLIENGGGTNDAEDSFIGAGDLNFINSYKSGIGAGNANSVTGTNAFVAAGNINDIAANHDFIGAGDFNMVGGSGSAIVAGGYEYFLNNGTPFGNQVTGVDAFIGAGDLNLVSGSGSVIGGGDYLYAQSNLSGGSNVGGYDSFLGAGDQNTIAADESFIGSGLQNDVTSNATYGAIGAGTKNEIDGTESFIGAGYNNKISSSSPYSSILGGGHNSVGAQYASIIGGYGNTANGQYGIVAGGNGDLANGLLSFAAGYHASATHNGSFVWSDYVSGSAAVADTAIDQFLVRASGGVFLYSNEAASTGVELAPGSGTWASLSDRNAKADIVPLDDASVLAKVATLPISVWRYKSEAGVRHAGPMAQDFYAAFGIGEDDRHITSLDEDGVALAAVKAVNAKLNRENRWLRAGEERDHAQIVALQTDMLRIEAAVRAAKR